MKINWIIILLGCLSLSSCHEEETSQKTHENDPKQNLEITFAEALAHVRDSYCNQISESKLVESAINGLLAATDSYSTYLSPLEYDNINNVHRGAFGGIGLEVLATANGLKIITALKDTPAQRANILSGEHIVKINGIDVNQMNSMQAIQMLQGNPGTTVTLTIQDQLGIDRDIDLQRALISISPVTVDIKDTVGYIKINLFNEQTVEKIKDAIKQFKKADKLTGLIIDLRNNPGGILEDAIHTTGMFLDKSIVVTTKGRSPDDIHEYKVSGPDQMRGIPILILINQGSASGAEIMAAALKDHKRAILMGTKTFGKGSVQTLFPLSNHGAIKLTTAYFYSPKMQPIHEKGVEPDFRIELADKNSAFDWTQDTQMQAALEFFKGLLR